MGSHSCRLTLRNNMIIGFTGKKGSGKTTASRMVLAVVRGSQHVNFKDAMVAEMKERLPKTIAALAEHYGQDVDWLFVNKPPIFRALMQDYGTTVRRGDNDRYWVDRWLESTAGMEHVVVDDVRFINEAEAVRNQGGIIIRLNRNDIVSTDNHQSEIEMDSIRTDYSIDVKEGGHDDLSQELDRILKGLVV
jgi:energy-coupling factor transporter ATP-binding protein EcfA2